MLSNRRIMMVGCAAFLLALGGCGGAGESGESASTSEASGQHQVSGDIPADAGRQLRELTSEEVAMLERVTEVAKLIEGSPDRAVAILAEHELTTDEWTTTMQDIAADAALSAAFEDAMGH